MTESENQILRQSVNDADLAQFTGGELADDPSGTPLHDANINSCVRIWYRDIQSGDFPNCAATVDERSWCRTNDACFTDAVVYRNTTDCSKAWK